MNLRQNQSEFLARRKFYEFPHVSQNSSKKKILIDLDVITIAKWNKQDKRKEQAIKFLERVENKEFYLLTPTFLLNRLIFWKDQKLANEITSFYMQTSDLFISDQQIREKLIEKNIDYQKLLEEFLSLKIKDEDVFIIAAASLLEIDSLVTFNRKHLHSKKEQINNTLNKYNIRKINIVHPDHFSDISAIFLSLSFLSSSLSLLKNRLPIPFLISSASFIGSTFAGIKTPSLFNSFLFPINKPTKNPINAFRSRLKEAGA